MDSELFSDIENALHTSDFQVVGGDIIDAVEGAFESTKKIVECMADEFLGKLQRYPEFDLFFKEEAENFAQLKADCIESWRSELSISEQDVARRIITYFDTKLTRHSHRVINIKNAMSKKVMRLRESVIQYRAGHELKTEEKIRSHERLVVEQVRNEKDEQIASLRARIATLENRLKTAQISRLSDPSYVSMVTDSQVALDRAALQVDGSIEAQIIRRLKEKPCESCAVLRDRIEELEQMGALNDTASQDSSGVININTSRIVRPSQIVMGRRRGNSATDDDDDDDSTAADSVSVISEKSTASKKNKTDRNILGKTSSRRMSRVTMAKVPTGKSNAPAVAGGPGFRGRQRSEITPVRAPRQSLVQGGSVIQHHTAIHGSDLREEDEEEDDGIEEVREKPRKEFDAPSTAADGVSPADMDTSVVKIPLDQSIPADEKHLSVSHSVNSNDETLSIGELVPVESTAVPATVDANNVSTGDGLFNMPSPNLLDPDVGEISNADPQAPEITSESKNKSFVSVGHNAPDTAGVVQSLAVVAHKKPAARAARRSIVQHHHSHAKVEHQVNRNSTSAAHVSESADLVQVKTVDRISPEPTVVADCTVKVENCALSVPLNVVPKSTAISEHALTKKITPHEANNSRVAEARDVRVGSQPNSSRSASRAASPVGLMDGQAHVDGKVVDKKYHDHQKGHQKMHPHNKVDKGERGDRYRPVSADARDFAADEPLPDEHDHTRANHHHTSKHKYQKKAKQHNAECQTDAPPILEGAPKTVSVNVREAYSQTTILECQSSECQTDNAVSSSLRTPPRDPRSSRLEKPLSFSPRAELVSPCRHVIDSPDPFATSTPVVTIEKGIFDVVLSCKNSIDENDVPEKEIKVLQGKVSALGMLLAEATADNRGLEKRNGMLQERLEYTEDLNMNQGMLFSLKLKERALLLKELSNQVNILRQEGEKKDRMLQHQQARVSPMLSVPLQQAAHMPKGRGDITADGTRDFIQPQRPPSAPGLSASTPKDLWNVKFDDHQEVERPKTAMPPMRGSPLTYNTPATTLLKEAVPISIRIKNGKVGGFTKGLNRSNSSAQANQSRQYPPLQNTAKALRDACNLNQGKEDLYTSSGGGFGRARSVSVSAPNGTRYPSDSPDLDLLIENREDMFISSHDEINEIRLKIGGLLQEHEQLNRRRSNFDRMTSSPTRGRASSSSERLRGRSRPTSPPGLDKFIQFDKLMQF